MRAGGFQSEVITATPAPEIVGVMTCGRNKITETLRLQGNRLTPLEEVVGAGRRAQEEAAELKVDRPPVSKTCSQATSRLAPAGQAPMELMACQSIPQVSPMSPE